MRRLLPVFFLLALPLLAQDREGQSKARGALDDAAILKHLSWMRENQKDMMNVAPKEGEYLHDLLIKLKAKRALEVGTSNGYSGVWMGMALKKTRGKLITLEIDERRASLARENFAKTGMDRTVELRLTDALKEIPKLQGPFDLVFIDAWKQDYMNYLEMTLPLVRSGGVIVAHNTRDAVYFLAGFIQRVKTDPQLKTEFVDVGPSGFSVSWKK